MEWRSRAARARKATQAFVVKHWLPLCFLVATVIALSWPVPGRAVVSVTLGDFRVAQTINIVIVFLISGLVLRTEDIKKALSYWPGIVYGFVAILGITPCLGFALRELPLSPPEFAIGLAIFAAVPTTLGVGEALVRASRGNAALALLLLVGTNALGIATMPPWLKVLLSDVDGLHVSVDAVKLLYKLAATVLLPALIGKAARELFAPVGRFASKYKQQLGMFSTVQLALIIWQTLSGAQDVLVHQRFTDILLTIVAAVVMHALYLVLNFLATLFVLRMPLSEAIGASIMSSQKSAPVAVTAISYLTSDVTQQGLLSVPCITGQLAQIFMGAALAPQLARRVARQEAAAAAAEAAAKAEAADLEGGADVGGSKQASCSSLDGGAGGKEGAAQQAEGKGGAELPPTAIASPDNATTVTGQQQAADAAVAGRQAQQAGTE